MLDAIKTASRYLRPYDFDSNHSGPLIISVVMKKLSEEFCFAFLRQMPVGKQDLAKLLELFFKELASRERCKSIKSLKPFFQIIDGESINSGSILRVVSENHN